MAVGIYFALQPYVGTEEIGWMCILGAAPFAACGFFTYHGMTAEQVLWAWFKSEILCPKRLVFKSDSYYYEAVQPAIRAGIKRKRGLPMIEIYLLTSLAPIPFATVPNRETGHMGQNYFRSLFAVGFQGLLILVCVAIYAVLIQSIATDGDPIGAIWGCVGYTVLLCFTLFKTGSLAKSIFGCH